MKKEPGRLYVAEFGFELFALYTALPITAAMSALSTPCAGVGRVDEEAGWDAAWVEVL